MQLVLDRCRCRGLVRVHQLTVAHPSQVTLPPDQPSERPAAKLLRSTSPPVQGGRHGGMSTPKPSRQVGTPRASRSPPVRPTWALP